MFCSQNIGSPNIILLVGCLILFIKSCILFDRLRCFACFVRCRDRFNFAFTTNRYPLVINHGHPLVLTLVNIIDDLVCFNAAISTLGLRTVSFKRSYSIRKTLFELKNNDVLFFLYIRRKCNDHLINIFLSIKARIQFRELILDRNCTTLD
ncbi:MAG: hypothetical protein IIY06_13755 [Proteobacteria bacterium]|nr:hypothetical protein [Pseudomonadota bacterium]